MRCDGTTRINGATSMTDTTETTALATAAERPSSGVSSSRRRQLWAATLWSLASITALAAGWLGAATGRSNRVGPATAVADSAEAESPVAADGQDRVSLVVLSAPATDDPLHAIGASLDDPQWDGKQKSAAELPLQRDVPESQRWQISFPSGTTEVEYARQLAAFQVELGVVRPDGTVEYVASPGTADAKRRTGRRADESRVYWTWSQGNLVKADKSLLRHAGIDAGDDLILHLWSPATAEKLTKLEREYKGRKPLDIFLTRFAIKRTFRGYEIYVQEQVGR
jgi:hypothetical protein